MYEFTRKFPILIACRISNFPPSTQIRLPIPQIANS
jgi:hypothetical protein